MTSSEGRFQLLFLFSRLSEFSKKTSAVLSTAQQAGTASLELKLLVISFQLYIAI